MKDDSVGGDTNQDGSTTTPTGGDWQNIRLNTTGILNMNYSTIRYGGYNTNYYASVYLTGNANALIENSTIAYSKYMGIRAKNSTAGTITHLTIHNSLIENNTSHGIQAKLSDGNHIVEITNSSMNQNGGNGFSGVVSDGLIFNNNQMNNNADYAMSLGLNGAAMPALSGLSGSGNGYQGILLDGPFAQDTTLPLFTDFPYILKGSWIINSGASLTLPAGLIIKTGIGDRSKINVYGELISEGTQEQPIVITSLYDDSFGGDTNGDGEQNVPAAGNWDGIEIKEGGSAVLDNTIIRYGGSSVYCPRLRGKWWQPYPYKLHPRI